MDINQSSLTRYKSGKPGIARSSSENKAVSEAARARRGSAATPQNLSQLSLKEGQVVKGQIIDLRYHEVQIRIEPGNQVITAKLSGDIPVSIGQEAVFQITENSGSSLVLKYLPGNQAVGADAMIQKALTASGFPLTEKNRALVLELLQHNMPIDKQTLQTMIKLSHRNPSASPLTLVLMYKNNIPITPENVKQFEAYQQGTNRLLNDISAISKNITELLKNQTELQSREIQNPMNSQPAPNTTNVQVPPEAVNRSDNPALLNTTPTMPEGQVLPPQLLQRAAEQIIRMNSSLIDILYPTTGQAPAEASLPANMAGNNPIPSQGDSVIAIKDVLNPSERASLLEHLKTLPLSEEIKIGVESGTVSLQKLLTELSQSLLQAGSKGITLLQSSEYNLLLENAFLNRWTLRPEEVAAKNPVKELYQNLQQDTEKLTLLLKSIKEEDTFTNLKEPVKNLRENVSFLKDLNQVFQYVPLPMQLKDKQLHSELYVYTRKNSQLEKQDSLSVLLHLDMDHMGPLNIHVQMQQSRIHTKFHTESPEVEQLLKEHLPLLISALSERGYQLQAEVDCTYQEPDFITDLINRDSLDGTTRRYTFDIRT